MNLYFFDFDDTPDEYGIAMKSAEEAFSQALRSMPEYAADLLLRNAGRTEMTCSIRENDSPALYKIIMSMRVENAAGETIEAPFQM